MSANDGTSAPRFTAFVAIDWADRRHVFAWEEAATGQRQTGSIEHTPEAVASWVAQLRQRFGEGPIALALEQSRGALLAMLTHYENLVIYPVNPATVAGMRRAFFPSGAKDDPPDAALLLDLLTRHRDRLRPLELDTVEMRTLQFLVEERRQFVNEKTRQKNRLTAQLKLYYPQVLAWFDDIDTELVEEFLRRWPTLEGLRQARPATRDGAVVAAATAAVPILLDLIRVLRQGMAALDEQIRQITARQEDFAVFDSFPAAGPALAPRLLAAFGTRRERFAAAAQMQAYSGIAPVTQRSGRHEVTRFRWGAPKFLRQSFHEFAAFSTRKSVWARAYYEQQRARGKSHHCAVRSLAFKWIRILFRCWQDGTPYDEGRYLQALARRGSSLVASLPAVADLR